MFLVALRAHIGVAPCMVATLGIFQALVFLQKVLAAHALLNMLTNPARVLVDTRFMPQAPGA